jgi:DNA processing protein
VLPVDFRQHVFSITLDEAPALVGLRDLQNPPARLYIAGTLPEPARCVAIVGTRRACPEARGFTRALAADLAARGWTVVSGGASGIDFEAHAGALEAGGQTVAFLGTPVEDPYPRQHMALFGQIAAQGCLLSEHARVDPVYQSSFLERNRLIAAMADLVVVVEAPFDSGAMSTAAHARRLARPVLAVPHAPWDPRGQGCLQLLAEGAKICRGAADVLSLAPPKAGLSPPRAAGPTKKRKKHHGHKPTFEGDEQLLVTALTPGPATVDELCEHTGLAAPRVQRAALMLMLSKVIQEIGGGRYARVDRA